MDMRESRGGGQALVEGSSRSGGRGTGVFSPLFLGE